MPTTLIEAPASTASQKITTLASLDTYDAILNDDYAWVAFKETDADGTWRVRIKARHLTGVVFEPEMMHTQARTAGAQGRPFFTWGNGMDPSAGDARSVQYRVHVKDGKPAQIEIAATMRKADGTAAAPVSATFDWPA